MSSTVEENATASDLQTNQSESEENKTKEPSDQENREDDEIVDVNSTDSGSESENQEGMEERFRGDSVVSIPEITLPEYIKQSGESSSNSSKSSNFLLLVVPCQSISKSSLSISIFASYNNFLNSLIVIVFTPLGLLYCNPYF